MISEFIVGKIVFRWNRVSITPFPPICTPFTSKNPHEEANLRKSDTNADRFPETIACGVSLFDGGKSGSLSHVSAITAPRNCILEFSIRKNCNACCNVSTYISPHFPCHIPPQQVSSLPLPVLPVQYSHFFHSGLECLLSLLSLPFAIYLLHPLHFGDLR